MLLRHRRQHQRRGTIETHTFSSKTVTFTLLTCHRLSLDWRQSNHGKTLKPARIDRIRHRLTPNVPKGKLAGVTGLEPATSAVTGQRSEPIELHPRVASGITMVGAKGLEPLTPSV